MRAGLLLMAVVAVLLGVWWLTSPRPRFVFGKAPEAAWRSLTSTVLRILEQQLSEPIRRAADALGWPSSRVALITGILAAMFLLFALGFSWWVAMLAFVPILAVSWRIAGWMTVKQYQAWQRQMVEGLPALIAVLRVHLDLGRTVQDALFTALPGVREPLRSDLKRTLSDMSLSTVDAVNDRGGDAREALQQLSARVDRLEFRTFTNTITQAWSSKLSGAALEPLQDLLRITREREAEETTSRLDMVMTTAPGLAIFGVMIWMVGGWLLNSFAGNAGLF